MPHLSRPALILLLALLPVGQAARAQDSISFTADQAESGRGLYREQCQICHGSSLANGQFGTPLRGRFFRDKWQGKSLGELQQWVWEKMPPDKVMSLEQDQVAALVAFILARNDLPAGTVALSGDHAAHQQVPLPW